MHTRLTPTGHQPYRDVRLQHAPDPRHTDPARALAALEVGLTPPVGRLWRSAVTAERQPTWFSAETPEIPSRQESPPAPRLATAFQYGASAE